MDAPVQSIRLGAGHSRRFAQNELRARPTVCVLTEDVGERAGIVEMLTVSDYDVMAFATTGEFLGAHLPPGPHCLLVNLWLSEQPRAELENGLARRGLTMPMVFMVASDDTIIGNASMNHAGIEFLLKPFTAATLFAVVSQALSIGPE